MDERRAIKVLLRPLTPAQTRRINREHESHTTQRDQNGSEPAPPLARRTSPQQAARRPTKTTPPAPSVTNATPNLAAGDTSNGADNFYTSDRVTVEKVTFKNQYRMNVTGNLFVPNDLDRNAKNAAMVVGHPMGAVKEQSANLYATKMAEQGFVTMSLDLSFWGESDGRAPQRCRARHLRRGLQRRSGLPAHPVIRRQGTHRRARDLRQRQLRHQRRQDRPAHQSRRDGQHVRHGRRQPQRAAPLGHPRAAQGHPRSRPRNSAMSSSPAVQPNTPAARPKS